MSGHRSRRPVPLWVTIVIIICMLPVFSFPGLLASCPAADTGARTILWCYPFYVIVAAWLAWASWSERPYITWILLILMLLSHASAWILVSMP